MILRDALDSAGTTPVSVCFSEEFRKEHSDRFESLGWALHSRHGGYDMIKKLSKTTFPSHTLTKLLDMTVSRISPKSAYRAYYGDHDTAVPAEIEIFVKLPVQYCKDL